MEEILHQLLMVYWNISKKMQGFIDVRWWSPDFWTISFHLSFRGCTWRIIPVSKWLITMVSKSPNWGAVPLPNGLFMAYINGGGVINYLQVLGWPSKYSQPTMFSSEKKHTRSPLWIVAFVTWCSFIGPQWLHLSWNNWQSQGVQKGGVEKTGSNSDFKNQKSKSTKIFGGWIFSKSIWKKLGKQKHLSRLDWCCNLTLWETHMEDQWPLGEIFHETCRNPRHWWALGWWHMRAKEKLSLKVHDSFLKTMNILVYICYMYIYAKYMILYDNIWIYQSCI